jgi:hypothetical protein
MTETNYNKYPSCRFAEGPTGKRQADAAILLEGAFAGDRRDEAKLFEALTTSDTPVLLAPALNRKIIDAYSLAYAKIWPSFASRLVVSDFRAQEINKYIHTQTGIATDNGGETFIAGTLPRVPEGGEYKTIGVTASGKSYRISKAGEQFRETWERVINNRDLSELERAIKAFGLHAAQTEDVEATKQFILGGTEGISGLAELTGNPVLSAAALKAAKAAAVAQTLDGRPVVARGGYNLIIPPALEETAKEILAVTQVVDGSNPAYWGPNPLAGDFTIVVNEWMPVIDPSNGNKSWLIAPKPGTVAEDQGIGVAFLRGYEVPDISIKSSERYDASGALVGGLAGDYDHDAIATRIRHVVSGVTLGFAGWVSSSGDAT